MEKKIKVPTCCTRVMIAHCYWINSSGLAGLGKLAHLAKMLKILRTEKEPVQQRMLFCDGRRVEISVVPTQLPVIGAVAVVL